MNSKLATIPGVTPEPDVEPKGKGRRLVSLPFMVLRGVSTAGVTLAALIQIFVFARTMTPEQFSIFILVGAFGYALWLADFGIVKYLFVRLRAAHLSKKPEPELVKQATLVVLFYASLVVVGAVICFVLLEALNSISALHAFKYSLFFTFTALNLVWYALRNISFAVDDYVYFECIEAVRRFTSIALMLSMLVGLPLLAFLLLVNALWLIVLAVAVTRLLREKALSTDLSGGFSSLVSFYRDNRKDLMRSGTSATADFYIEHLPYLVVPLDFGLGAPTVILDTIFKFYRGANLFFHAACEIVLPTQTHAFAERDRRTMIRSTALAFTMCLIPTLFVTGVLIVASEPLFKLLLGPAATMPPAAVWVIIALLFGNMLQTVSSSLLIHTGYFQASARVMLITAVCATIVGAANLLMEHTIVSFMAAYATVYIGGAVLHTVIAIRGPMRAMRKV
jgi:O-antigen/teichoic acid export membrane protein